MQKILGIFLFVIFSSSLSLAKNNEKITMEEIKDILLYSETPRKIDLYLYDAGIIEKEFDKLKKSGTIEKRIQNRGLAKCMYKNLLEDDWLDGQFAMDNVNEKQCFSQLIRSTFSRTEKNQKRKPGTIFYAIESIERFVFSEETTWKFVRARPASIANDGKIKYYTLGDEVEPESNCIKYIPYSDGNYGMTEEAFCIYFSKYTKKKLDKFKKDPSNEKVLGRPLIKYIKNVRMVRSIREKLGNENFAILGDMLNASVVEVKKNNISPDLQKRRALLKKYSLILKNIKQKLNEDKYKSIDKDVSKLSKTYENLKALITNETVINIDKAVDKIFDTNKLIQKSVLNSKDNEEEKLLALSSIYFMQTLIDSILSTIPEKYYVKQKGLNEDLFNDDDLDELDTIINTMIKKNKEIKSAELAKNTNMINKYINTSDVIKTLDNLGMKNSINREFTQNTVAEIVDKQLRDNLDKEILKEAKKLLKEIDTKELSDLTKEASDVAKEISDEAEEVASDPGIKNALDRKHGGHSLRFLIGACKSGRSIGGLC